jgi:hypothetical protein
MADPLIRYYHYISAEKVTEAVSQVPPDLLERLKVELKLPFVSVGNTGGGVPDELYAQADLAAAALTRQGQVGSIAVPSGWFAGTVTMRWGCFGREHPSDRDVVFFMGRWADTYVVLGGSAWNARRTGYSTEPRPYSNSGVYTLMRALRIESQRIREAAELRAPPPISDRDDPDVFWQPALENAHDAWPGEALEVYDSLPGRGEDVEFVARWLDRSGYPFQPPMELGSPLYVASAVGIAPPEPAPAPPAPPAQERRRGWLRHRSR